MIYLDNNASTPLCDEAFAAMIPWLRDNWANPSSVQHAAGRDASAGLHRARETLAEATGCEPGRIIFTSGATEANTLALRGARRDGGALRRIVTTEAEHLATLTGCVQARASGVEVTMAPLTAIGAVTPESLGAVGLGVGDLVSIQWINNETGVINDVAGIVEFASARGALVHIDGAQALGKVPVDLRALGADYVTLSGHKAHGPKGVGALVLKSGAEIKPLWTGGSQEGGRRGGTENLAAIAGFAAAAAAAVAAGDEALQRMARQRDSFEQAVLKDAPGGEVVAAHAPRAPNTSMISWRSLNGREFLKLLDRRGVAASSASACTMGLGAGSHVLVAMGLPEEAVRGALRFSLSRFTTDAEVKGAIAAVVGVARTMSDRRRHIGRG